MKRMDTKYYKYFENGMKEHPKMEGVRWAVYSGENMTAMVLEADPARAKLREKPFPNQPFTGGEPHFHKDFEQITLFLGCTPDTPEEVRGKHAYEPRNTANEFAVLDTSTIMWLPRFTVHDIDLSEEQRLQFMRDYYPDGYPEGIKFYFVDIFSPPREDYYEYWKNQK